MVDIDIVSDKSVYGKHWKWSSLHKKSTPPEGDKDAALLFPALYLLKQMIKKEKQRCYSLTKCSFSILFKVRGKSNVKDQISALKILSCIEVFLFVKCRV